MSNNQSVNLIVSGEAGSIFDKVGRVLVEGLRTAMGAPVTLENVGDSSGVGGAEQGARAGNDGTTLILCNKGAMTSHPHTAKTYQASDFEPLCQVAEAPIALAVRAGGDYDSLDQLFAAAKQGKAISFSTPNPYHTQRLALAAFAFKNDIAFNYVKLPGGNSVAIQNLVSGVVDFAFLAAHNLIEARAAGDIKILAVAHPTRLAFLPEEPTFLEQGYDFVTAIWLGLFAPVGVAADRLRVLREAAVLASADRAVQQGIAAVHMVPTFIDSAAFQTKVAADSAFHLEILRKLGAL